MTYKEQYKKERKRIQSFIRSAEKRGYRFSDNILPKQPKRIRKESVERLKKLTRTELYKKSTALSESGKVVSGLEAERERRSKAAKKGARIRKEAVEHGFKTAKEYRQYKKWEKQREKQDIIDRTKAENIQEGRVIWEQIMDLKNSIGGQGAIIFDGFISSEIANRGLDAVLFAIAQAPKEFYQAAQIVIHYRDKSLIQRSIIKMGFIISGNKIDTVLAKQLGEILDELDEMYSEYE